MRTRHVWDHFALQLELAVALGVGLAAVSDKSNSTALGAVLDSAGSLTAKVCRTSATEEGLQYERL